MKKKIFTIALVVFSMTSSLIVQHPYTLAFADDYEYDPTEYDPTEYGPIEYDPTEYDPIEYDPTEYNPTKYDPTDDDDPIDIIELTPDDVTITPLSKKIKVGSSFKIGVVQKDPDFWEKYDEDVWDEAYEDSIEGIVYKSKKSYIAKVNANGVVKGRHKGTTVITATIYFTSGARLVKKVTVRVKK